MDKFFEAIENHKNSLKKAIHENIIDVVPSELLEKGKRGQIGEIRTWGGKKYQKTINGWVPTKTSSPTEKKYRYNSEGKRVRLDKIERVTSNDSKSKNEFDLHAGFDEFRNLLKDEEVANLYKEWSKYQKNLSSNELKILNEKDKSYAVDMISALPEKRKEDFVLYMDDPLGYMDKMKIKESEKSISNISKEDVDFLKENLGFNSASLQEWAGKNEKELEDEFEFDSLEEKER